MRTDRKKYWLFILPVLIPFILSVIVPALFGVYYSFTDWNGISPTIRWVGLANYQSIFSGKSSFMNSFLFTVVFAFLAVVLVNVVGFLLALLLTRGMKGSNLFRTIFFMPNLIGGLLLGFTWQFIFTNVFEAMGKQLGIAGLSGWLSNKETGFWGLIIVFVWQLSGYMMIIYIAGIQGVPQSLIEAAVIDGAGPIKRLTHIIMPMVAQSFTIGLFLTLSNAFKLFDPNLSLTNGGPYRSTEMMALNIYNTAFLEDKLGLAQAKAMIFLVMIAIITLTQLYFSKKQEVEM